MRASAATGVGFSGAAATLPPAFTASVVTTACGGVTTIAVADIDGDSDIDVVGTCYSESSASWFENTGGTPLVYMKHSLCSGCLLSAVGLDCADLDGDGDVDIIANGQV